VEIFSAGAQFGNAIMFCWGSGVWWNQYDDLLNSRIPWSCSFFICSSSCCSAQYGSWRRLRAVTPFRPHFRPMPNCLWDWSKVWGWIDTQRVEVRKEMTLRSSNRIIWMETFEVNQLPGVLQWIIATAKYLLPAAEAKGLGYLRKDEWGLASIENGS